METNEFTAGESSAPRGISPVAATPTPIPTTPAELAPAALNVEPHEDYGYLGNLKTGDTLPGAGPSNIQRAAREGRDYLDNVNLK